MKTTLLSESLEKAFIKVLENMSLEELKKLDWATYNTDFFIEQGRNENAA